MTHPDTDRLMEHFLEGLAPVKRPVDAAFLARLEVKIAELERYRAWRSRMVRRLATNLAAVAAIGVPVAFITMAPVGKVDLAAQPGPVSMGLFVMFLSWFAVTEGKPTLL